MEVEDPGPGILQTMARVVMLHMLILQDISVLTSKHDHLYV